MPALKKDVRGRIAELEFIQVALEMGVEVAVSVTPGVPWDALLSWSDTYPQEWRRVQIKRCYSKNGHPTVNLVRAGNKRYEANDVDYLAAVEVRSRRIWLVPWAEVCRYQRKRLTPDMDRYLLRPVPRVSEGDDADGLQSVL